MNQENRNEESTVNHKRHMTEKGRKKLSEVGSLRTGENNGFYGKHHTEETKKYLSELASERIGENNSFYGRHHTEETKELIRQKKLNVKFTKEHREKISEALKGENNPNYGKALSEETKKKMSESRKATVSAKGERDDTYDGMPKRVMQYDKSGNFIKEWVSLSKASKGTNVNSATISLCCNGKRMSAGGFIWKFK